MITISRVADLGRLTRVENLSGVTFTGEDEGHKFVITATLDDAIVPLTGSVSGKFIRPGGYTVALTQAEGYAGIEDGKAWVSLAGNCYSEAGPFGLTITHIDGEKRTVIYACAGYVRPGETSSIVDPESLINVDAIAGMIDDLQDAIEAAEGVTDDVDDLKSEVNELYNSSETETDYTWTQNKYLSNASGTIDVVNGFVSSSSYECVVIPCEKNNILVISAYAQTTNRAWAFVRSSGEVMTDHMCEAGGGGENIRLVAPTGAAYLVCNNRPSSWPSGSSDKYGKAKKIVVSKSPKVDECINDIEELNGDLEDLQGEVDDIKDSMSVTKSLADSASLTSNGYIKYDTGESASSSTGYKSTGYINIQGAKSITVVVPILTSASSHAGIAYYDSSKTYISNSGVAYRVDSSSQDTFETITITSPSNAVYIRTAFRTAEISNFYMTAVYDVTAQQLINAIDDVKNSADNALCMGMQMFEKIGVIGDSISCGWAYDKNDVRSRRNLGISWPQQMARRLGCTAYNLGASGVDPVEWFQSSYEFYQYCYPQYQSVGECNLYIIGLGLNQPSSIGSTSDINQSDYTQNGATFYGQYARIIQMINAEHPDAIVMCLTEPTPDIQTYDQAVRDICALSFINAELVDLENDYSELFTTPEIMGQMQSDNRHFKPYGYSLIAGAMMKALNDYIGKHPDHFRYVGVAHS